MHERRGMSKKVLKIVVSAVLVIAIGVPSTTYAYNKYNYNKYLNEASQLMEKDSFSEAKKSFNKAAGYDIKNTSAIQENIKHVEELEQSKSDFDEAKNLMESKQHLEAIEKFKMVIEEDKLRYEESKSNIEECKTLYVNENLDKAKKDAESKNYNSAIGTLDVVIGFDSSNEEAAKLKEQYTNEVNRIKAEEEAASKAAEEARKVKEQVVNKTESQRKTNTAASIQVVSQGGNSEPSVKINGNSMHIFDGEKTVGVQFIRMRGFFSLDYNVVSFQYTGNNPPLFKTLDYKATFKYSIGEKVVSGKTAGSPSSNMRSIELPSGEDIKVTIEVIYNQKPYSFTTSFSTGS